jgi:hypothetical protein
MALLTRALSIVGCCALLGSCEGSESLGHADLWLSNCDDRASCGENQPGEHFAVQAYFEPSVSRYAPHGLYAYVELPRADGTRGVLELDVPTDGPSDGPLDNYQISYRELSNERLRFESRAVRGQIMLPRSLTEDDAASCGCDEGVFALQFTDANDHVRALSLGHLSRSESMCHAGMQTSEEEGLRVNVKSCETAPAPSMSPPAAEVAPVASSPHSHDEHYTTVDSYTTVDTGCGSSSYEDQSSGGCGSSDDGQSSSSGCGNDDGEDSSSHSGCEGDTSDQPSSCAVARGPHRGGSPFMGTGLPVLLVCLWQVLRTTRKRRASVLQVAGQTS